MNTIDFRQLIIAIDFNIFDIEYSCFACGCHNNSGPAIINVDGDKYWFINGIIHNSFGPAEICSEGTKIWYMHGRFKNKKEC